MSRTYSVTEPHPSVVKGGYIGTGRGGAGNYKHYKSSELSAGPSATGPAARVTLPQPETRNVAAGRGGAGNMFRATPPAFEAEQRVFQFDEEMVKRREAAAPMYHIGRGGAANFVDETKPRANRMGSTDSTASISSERSTGSSVRRSVEGAFGRMTRKLSKN